MTHTLHRIKNTKEFEDDYVVLAMPAKGINDDENVVKKMKKFINIFSKHNPVNIGGIGIGHLYNSTSEKIINSVTRDLPMVHGVFSNKDDLVAVLKEIKNEDMGISITVSGLSEWVNYCAKEVGLRRHSINYSLGIWGNKTKLPNEKYLEITTMCGHSMVSANLLKKMIAEIKKGTKSIDQAASELAKPCSCGIFNVEKAKKIIEELI